MENEASGNCRIFSPLSSVEIQFLLVLPQQKKSSQAHSRRLRVRSLSLSLVCAEWCRRRLFDFGKGTRASAEKKANSHRRQHTLVHKVESREKETVPIHLRVIVLIETRVEAAAALTCGWGKVFLLGSFGAFNLSLELRASCNPLEFGFDY